MPEHIVIAHTALSDAGTLTSVSPGSDVLAVSNLQQRQPGDLWRSTAVAGAAVELDLGAAREIDLIGLLYTNAETAATWRVRAATSQANLTAAPGYDSTAVSVWPTTGLEDWPFVHGILWLGANTKTFQWWRVDYADSGNADGFLQAGRLIVAKAWQPTRNRRLGMNLGFLDPSPQRKARGGQTHVLELERARRLDFSLQFLTETEVMANAFELQRLRGRAKDILVIPDPTKTTQQQRQAIYGVMPELSPISDPRFDHYEVRFAVEEMLP